MRAESSALDELLAGAEAAAGESIGSLLIRPVQRLCKYPLLFRELLHAVPAAHPSRGALLRAAAAVTTVAGEVNERVRDAERRAGMVLMAHAVGEPGLVVPVRALLLERDASAEQLSPGGLGGLSLRAFQPAKISKFGHLLGWFSRGRRCHISGDNPEWQISGFRP